MPRSNTPPTYSSWIEAAKDAAKATQYLLGREKECEPDSQPVDTGQHRDGDWMAVPDVVRSETSEHTAAFDTRTGAVEIKKDTATETRELF